jgi:hypothetical protein
MIPGDRASVGLSMWVPSIMACAMLAAIGCAAAPFDGTTYRGDRFAFRIPAAPASWERLDVSHAALAYRDRGSDATIALNGRCGSDGEDVPLASLTQHLFLSFTEREVIREEVVPFDGREAMHTEVNAKLDGVPKRFDVWVMKKDGCVYDLIYIARPDGHEAGLEAFHRFVQGFATVPADVD